MKKFNISFLTVLSLVALTFMVSSCEDSDKFRVPELGNGGFVKFVYQPDFWEGIESVDTADGAANVVYYHIGADPAESNFVAVTEDPNENISSCEWFVRSVRGDSVTSGPVAYKSTTTFPFDVSFTTAEMEAILGFRTASNPDSLRTGDELVFSSMITTNDGRIYISDVSNCVDCPAPGEDDVDENGIVIPFEDPGSWNGGTIDQVVLQGGDTGENFVIPAVWYKVKYEAPSE